MKRYWSYVSQLTQFTTIQQEDVVMFDNIYWYIFSSYNRLEQYFSSYVVPYISVLYVLTPGLVSLVSLDGDYDCSYIVAIQYLTLFTLITWEVLRILRYTLSLQSRLLWSWINWQHCELRSLCSRNLQWSDQPGILYELHWRQNYSV